MIRCLQCRHPNSEKHVHCRQCGQLLPRSIERPSWRQELAARKWVKIMAVALGMLLFRLMAHPYISRRTGLDANHLLYQLLEGGLLAQGLAWCLGLSSRQVLVWGLGGGLLSFALDFLVTWHWLLYKGVWTASYFFNEGSGSRAAAFSYGLLQVARFAGPCLLLWLYSARRQGTERASWIGLGAVSVALILRFYLRGSGLSFSDFGGRDTAIYLTSVFVLLGGIAGKQG